MINDLIKHTFTRATGKWLQFDVPTVFCFFVAQQSFLYTWLLQRKNERKNIGLPMQCWVLALILCFSMPQTKRLSI